MFRSELESCFNVPLPTSSVAPTVGGELANVPVFVLYVGPEPNVTVVPVLISTPFVKTYVTPDEDPGNVKAVEPEITGGLFLFPPVKQTTPFTAEGIEVLDVIVVAFDEFVPLQALV